MTLDPSTRARIAHLLGEEGLLEGGDAERYGRDETPGLFQIPDLVVRPRDASQTAALLELATAESFPVIPRGAGTGVVAGAIPFGGGVILSLERMNSIVEIDVDNMMAVVEPAVITGELQREVEARGLFYPPDPASLDSCSIGGNVATGAGGARAVKYGVTKDYVTGLQAVLPTGETLELGGKIVKYATGYHLLDLLVGSEGTLGVITRVTLRLLALPTHRVALLVPFPGLEDAAAAVAEIIRRRFLPAALEFMDRGSIRAVASFLERDLPFPDAGAHLLIEVDGHREETVQSDYEAIGELCLDGGAADVLVADSRPAQESLWEGRRAIGEAVKAGSRNVGKQDIVVPRMAIPEFVERLGALGRESGLEILCFGHAGDGNVHVNICQKDIDDAPWRAAVAVVFPKVVDEVYRLGGVLSGEHGIGWLKKGEMARMVHPRQVELMRGIKKAFDPAGILNPGKIFDP